MRAFYRALLLTLLLIQPASAQVMIEVAPRGGGEGGAGDFSELTGNATDAQVPDDITIDLAAEATALAAIPSPCTQAGGVLAFAHTIAANGDLTCSILVRHTTADPTVNDDTGDGYIVGTKWINTSTDLVWEAVDVTLTAAVWKPQLSTGQSGILTVSGNSISLATAVRDLSGRGCADAGGDDTYACNMGIADTSYITRAFYSLTPVTANTGPASVDYSSLGAKNIKKFVSGSKVDPADGDICANQTAFFYYDGTDMVLFSTLCNPASGAVAGTEGTIGKFGADGDDMVDSAITEDADSINFAKLPEFCPTTCLFALDTSIFETSLKSWDFPANADDTFVGEDAAQTLINKSIDGDDNTITDLPVSSVVNALKEEVKNFTILEPTTGDTNALQIQFPAAVTLIKVSCSTRGASSTATIQFDKRAEATPNTSGTDALTSALACDTDRQSTTSFSSATVAANQVLNLQITATANDPEVVRVHIHARLD